MTPEPIQEKPDPDPALVSPASPPLHPRYQREWERDTPNWPKEWSVEAEKHDLADRRFLTPEHQAAMDAGALDLPERTQSEHVAVLVSVPDGFGKSVSWVDRGVAEIVYHSTRLGAPTLESCEAADSDYGWDDRPYLWFKGRRQLTRFGEITEGIATDDWRWHYPRGIGFGRFSTYAVGIPAHDLPRVAAALREMES